MDTKLSALTRALEEKNQQIAAEYSGAIGRDIASLSAAELATLGEEVEGLIEEAEEALADGHTLEDWRAHDERLASTSIGRLILERHEIEEELLNQLEEQNGIGGGNEVTDDPNTLRRRRPRS